MLVIQHSKRIRLLLIKGSSFLFILLFVYAAISKLLDFETFRVQLAQSPLLSAYAGFIAWAVPGIEILIACLLIMERFRTLALYASFTLMVMFTAYIYIILNFSDFVPCSCGGVLEDLSWTQHLIFNAVFIVLAGTAVFLGKQGNNKMKLFLLVTLAIIGISIVALLFAFSEKKMHRNNAFQRRYIPQPMETLHEFNLEWDSYYIAGMDKERIYLGNYMAPLYLDEVDLEEQKIEKFSVWVSDTTLPYRRIRTAVQPPYFYLGDGTVPIVFRGNLSDRKAYPYYNEAYFTHFTIADTSNFGIVSISQTTGNNTLGIVNKKDSKVSVSFNDSILRKQVDGIIDSDGTLLWNEQHQGFIYVYRYRNTYEVIEKQLNPLFSGRTIDTISKAILDLAYYKKTGQYALGAKSVVVNKSNATDGDFLFIESERLGKFEDTDLETTSIIDVYNITGQSYAFSFRLYHDKGRELTGFKVYGELLAAIFGDTLILYKLKPAYFDTGSNTTHTGPYQEKTEHL
ncbi:MauE/DoxX family redox-associated membrane protein [Xanthomarina gelatinilytica]|uniref:MauE/DoxX family redox-associated membrane protein n=1 Tax=Xanthomarina gelatinilytica TaxID=1137281 RepID=UPI003AA92D2E